MYIQRVFKDDFRLKVRSIMINFKKGEAVFVETAEDGLTVKISHGNAEITLTTEKADSIFEPETAFMSTIIEEIATQVLKKIESRRKETIVALKMMDRR